MAYGGHFRSAQPLMQARSDRGFSHCNSWDEGAISAGEVHEDPRCDSSPALPEHEELSGRLGTVIRQANQPDEEIYFQNVIVSTRRLDTKSNRDGIPPLCDAVIRALSKN